MSRPRTRLAEGAATTTDDTVFTGFGAEGFTTADQREEFVARALDHLLG